MAPTRRLAGVMLAAVLLPMTLSGCLRTNTDVQVGNDGDIGTATIQIGINKDIAKQAGIYNLAGFETYMKTSKRIEDTDTCTYDQDQDEYLMDCRTANVVDNAGAFTGISATPKDGKLVVQARENALTADLAKYDPSGQAVGSITFYFDGDIESVNATNSVYRLPSSGIIAFDLKNGKFFHENVTVVVAPKTDNTMLYVLLGAATLGIIGVAYLISHRRKACNPFVAGADVEAPHIRSTSASGLVTAADQKAAMHAHDDPESGEVEGDQPNR